ncbi:MAG: hydroxyethylthiazole kinase [Propionibacteriaceae bacterium]|nr:hydroxyethylthiazole kinase [Propionibacteriaceae bacterium]
MLTAAAQAVARIRETHPLVHSITNYVTVNDVANILLSYGAAPAMVEDDAETFGFAQISSALYINLGTLTKEQELAAAQAVLGARQGNTPIVIDPVALGAIPRKAEVLRRLIELGTPAVIKGNSGEILALAGVAGAVRGVDAVGDAEGLEDAAANVAGQLGVVVAATGPVDIVSDGTRTFRIHNGHELLTRVTGAGCMVGALVAAASAVTDPLTAAVAGIVSMGVAGELAAQAAQLPGSFRVALIDAIYQVDAALIAERGRVDEL